LWNGFIINVRVTDTDAKSNRSKKAHAKVLAAHEREKKKKYLEACLEHHRHFTPFVVSTDGLLGKEAKILLKKRSALLAEKWENPYSQEPLTSAYEALESQLVKCTAILIVAAPTSHQCFRQ
jgi:hypothetical protein